jgi:SAM-dependent methyltransferase
MFSESEAYEHFMGRWSRELARLFVKFADIQGSVTVLDVGSGTGALTEAILAGIGTSQVVGVDPSVAYGEYARTRTADSRVTFEVGDGRSLRFPNATFDATLSLLVINFIPDPEKTLGEMIRVTRAGGVVAAAVWDYDEGMGMLRFFWDEAVLRDPSIEPRDERHMPFSRAGELASFWRDHGLLDVREAPLLISLRFQSFDRFWSPFLAG